MPEKKKFSFFRFLIYVLILVMMVGMCLFVYFSWQPQELTDIQGRDGAENETVVDLGEKMKAAKNGGYEITISEAEINRYLANRLKLEQTGFVDEYADVEGVYVDLQPGLVEVIVERKLDYVTTDANGDEKREFLFFPRRHTVSMSFKVFTEETENGATRKTVEFPPGKFGQVPAPGQFVLLVKPTFDVIAELFKDELDLGYHEMVRLEVGDGFIKMDPRQVEREISRPGE